MNGKSQMEKRGILMKNKLRLLGLALLMAGLITIGSIELNSRSISTINIPEVIELGLYEQERNDGGYFTIVDKYGAVLDKTARQVYVGDELIAADNKHYRVIKINGDTAIAEFVGQRDKFLNTNWGLVDIPVSSSMPVQGNKQPPLVAIYHTHTAESYEPSEGEAFVEAQGEEGKGGIINVGTVLSTKLEELGFATILNTSAHEPHDANAYHRSRRTAVELLGEQPMLLIDVHRDAVPDPDFYTEVVNEEEVSKIRLVVGRQNQNMDVNLEFAEALKAAVDEVHPGLMHAIFMARGNYNQDLAPRAILIEAGTHVTSREEAEKGVELFAEAIPKALGVSVGGGADRAPTTSGETRSVFWVIGLSLLAGGLFLLISTGSFTGARDKLKQFVGEEWANVLGRVKYKTRKAFKLEQIQKRTQQSNNKDDKRDE